MVRWESGAQERLRVAALRLIARDGFDGVTTARIAEEAGVTERTFFRHFADKREVLFTGQAEFDEHFLRGIRESPSVDAGVLIDAALQGGAAFLPDERRPWSRARQSVIDADPRLQERELLKLAALGGEMEAALVARGVPPMRASVAAQAALTVFRVAFQRWIAPGEERSFAELQSLAAAELRGVLAPSTGLDGTGRN